MTKIAFNKLNINKEDLVVNVDFNGTQIEVKQYLSLQGKQDIVDFALEASNHLPFVSRLISDAFFNYLVVLSYTNIELTTKKEKEDAVKTYDLMEKSGLIDLVLENIPEVELEHLVEVYEKAIEGSDAYKRSISGSLTTLIGMLPQLSSSVNSALEGLDAENLQILNELRAVVGAK